MNHRWDLIGDRAYALAATYLAVKDGLPLRLIKKSLTLELLLAEGARVCAINRPKLVVARVSFKNLVFAIKQEHAPGAHLSTLSFDRGRHEIDTTASQDVAGDIVHRLPPNVAAAVADFETRLAAARQDLTDLK